MKTNKFRVYLFEPTGILGWIIRLGTNCKYAHSAIEIVYDDGQSYFWDASESRGNFDVANPEELLKRNFRVWEFKGDLNPWAQRLIGTKYDWHGIFGWIFGSGMKRHFYCFEATWLGLMYSLRSDIDGVNPPPRLSGCSIESLCVALSK